MTIKPRTSFANPKRLMGFLTPLTWPFLALGLVLLGGGCLWGLLFSPPDYQQGDCVRIMYVHVPASWMALLVYGSCAVSALVVVVWRHGMAAVSLRAMLPIGLVFTTISLITGSLWGKPMWGTWWVWDARLTSMLILWFIYVGVTYLLQTGPVSSQQERLAAIFTLVGAINLPIIKWSVTWWQTLHQPASILRAGGNAIHSAFMGPLLTMALAFLFLFWGVSLLRMRMILTTRRMSGRG